ncbi:mitochondrial inner membrane protein OXA1-like [Salvia miltiorrhiza]|uniref:mitochondrial inner membrane protein OXA1-like n=1 Tax=Salvia miltiorrhiza TaxID=226208 RepID=UPI0025AD03D0|nr:mitochondrial inner membrane protein OXA1-like [Salvia miltiorrhiza]XP_057786318.1 mitochondrial inner membrane protein OXA1-like [Salvia miltiorrhiza]
MAYRRIITARAKLFYQHRQRISPSISNIHSDDDDSHELQAKPISNYPEIGNYIHNRFFVGRDNFSNYRRPTSALQDRRFSVPAGFGFGYGRNYSSARVGEVAADKIDVLNDVVVVLGDKAVEAAPAMNEVAIAAADSFAPVAALQYLIDYVHCFTGFNWWASIVVTTLIIRWLQIPLLIHQLKCTSKFALLKPEMEAVRDEMQNKGMNPSAVAEGQMKLDALYKKYGVSPFTPLKGLLISAPIFCCFFFAVSNMAEKVPSFRDGGILWFTDLSTPDSLYLFPVLSALTFWITVEINAQEGMEGNPISTATMKNVMRGFAALSIPLTVGFPKAVFCYWITSSLFSLGYGLVLKRPEVKKYLGIPDIPVTPPSTDQKPLSLFESLKKYADAQAQAQAQKQQSLPSSYEVPKPMSGRIASTTALNGGIKDLDKKVKGRKKGKKR